MANGAPFLFDLALVTGVAAVTTLLFHRLRQPVVVGYLLAGVLVGPRGPLGLQSVASVQTLAELGIVFLMFSIGLEFRLGRLTKAGAAAVLPALLGIAGVLLLTLLAGAALGWGRTDALFMGAILAISSTVIAAKALLERGEQHRRWAELALAVLIVQDVVAVLVLALLGAQGAQPVGVLEVVGVLGRLATFAMAALVLGLLFVPRVVNWLARGRADEVLVVTLAGLALGVAVLALLLGFSPALGAFLIGAVVGEASESWLAAQRVLPLRDLFTAVFFVSIGMLLDPSLVAVHWQAVVLLGALMVGAKLALHALPAFLLGAPPRDAFRASLALAQIGEFSFVIAALGLSLGVVSDFVLPVTVAIATASALWTPYLLRAADPAYAAAARLAPRGVGRAGARYQAWHARRAQARPRLTEEQRRLLARALRNAVAVGLIVLATSAFSEAVERFVTVRGLSDRTLALLPWMAGGVLALPFAFNAARAAWFLLAPARVQGGHGGAVRTGALVALSALGVFVVFLAVAPFLPPAPLLLLSLAAFMGAAIVLWETMVLVHAKVEAALEHALGGEAQGEQRRAVLEQLRHEYHWGAAVDKARVEAGTSAAGASVRALDLRARTGATLVAVQRAGRTLVNPPPGFVLEPGDQLVLLGEGAQLEQAREALREPSGQAAEGEEPRIAEVRVEEGSPLDGRTIAESALGERTGATVVGLLRQGRRLASPGAGTRVEAGDVLLVVGSEGQVREAGAMARGHAPPGPP